MSLKKAAALMFQPLVLTSTWSCVVAVGSVVSRISISVMVPPFTKPPLYVNPVPIISKVMPRALSTAKTCVESFRRLDRIAGRQVVIERAEVVAVGRLHGDGNR